jgi:hypothetical protein
MTKLFLDTEFTGLYKDAHLISISLVSECGNKFYAEFNDYPVEQLERMGCKDDVLNNLLFPNHNVIEFRKYTSVKNTTIKGNSRTILDYLIHHLSTYDSVEIISDCLAWDWVLFCDLFGGAFDIPKNVYYIPLDICGLFQFNGIDPDINRVEFSGGIEPFTINQIPFDSSKNHNSLYDALIIKKCYEKLMQ